MFTTRTELRSEHIDRDGDDAKDAQNNAKPFNTVENMTNVVGVDFDYQSGRIYFTQIRPQARIGWVDATNPRTPTDENVILDKGVNPEGIAFDWVHKKIYWTDSKVVLGYIKNDIKRFKIFVANRTLSKTCPKVSMSSMN